MVPSHAGRIAIVTGAGSGIGREIARELARRGAHVAIFDIDQRGGDATAEVIRSDGGHAEFRHVDVTDALTMKTEVERVAREGARLDYMFNNAGTCTMGLAEDLPLTDWQRVVAVNLFGVVHGIAAAYPIMIAQRAGHIVNTASLAGLMPVPGSASYVATKFAVVGLSHALRMEARAHGVRVSVVCPAAVETPIYDTTPFIGIDREKFKELVPGKPASAERFARSVVDGVDRNRATIAPGLAAVLSRIHRYGFGLTEVLGRSLTQKLLAIRTRPTDV